MIRPDRILGIVPLLRCPLRLVPLGSIMLVQINPVLAEIQRRLRIGAERIMPALSAEARDTSLAFTDRTERR